MKHNPYSKRPRNRMRRPANARGGYSPNRVFESNGPDVKLRGTALQLHDRYHALARDAQSSGDRVAAESYFQHAEHYQRLLTSMQEANDNADRQQPREISRGNGEEKSWSKDSWEETSRSGERNASPPQETRAGSESQPRTETRRKTVKRPRNNDPESSALPDGGSAAEE